jgi:hypothetical protein
VALVKRDRGRQPNSPAVRCRLRRRLIHQPTSPAVPSRLTSRQPCPICTTGPGRPEWPASPGVAPPGPPRCRVRRRARRPAPGRRPGGPGSRARYRPAGSRERGAPGDGFGRGPDGRHSSAAHQGRRSAPRTPTDNRHPPAADYRPPGPPPPCAARGSGDRGSPSERLAALGRLVAVRVVAELALVADQGWKLLGTTASTRPAASGGTGGARSSRRCACTPCATTSRDGSASPPRTPRQRTPSPATSRRHTGSWPPAPTPRSRRRVAPRAVGRLRDPALVRPPTRVPARLVPG